MEGTSHDPTWDFIGESTREFTHDFHLYPAVMNPHIARRLIKEFGGDSKFLLDPFCGSGTSLVEARIAGLSATGFDLNPAARLIARSKTRNYDIDQLTSFVSSLYKPIESLDSVRLDRAIEDSGFSEDAIRSWFPEETIVEVASFLDVIDELSYGQEDLARFAKISLSDCLRKVSFQRMNEWKNYRIEGWREKMDIEAAIQPLRKPLEKKLESNLLGAIDFMSRLENSGITESVVKVEDFNSVDSAMFPNSPDGGFDLVVTSPPYGDSQTTVAYEQFSWFANVWLGLDTRSSGNLGREMMGGMKKGVLETGCPEIDESISRMEEKFAVKNYSFYEDYGKSIANISKNVKEGGYACFVVGNRNSGGEVLRLDLFTRWAMEGNGFERVGDIIQRSLPGTRMPMRTSPLGKKGQSRTTMNYEYIIICEKK